ncbi:MAG: MBL fold metallo-hydrolase [Planctomycetota bacterium]|nr:MBL fold metallo-hydrolase [Planctomycetota bacterium]
MPLANSQLRPGIHRFDDTCNVYLVVQDGKSIAVDFGSGAWLEQAAAMGLPHPEHVFLTHHHADNCAGLLQRADWPFVVHAPAGEQAFLDPDRVAAFWRTRRDGGTPASYSVLPRGLPVPVRYDLGGFADFFWGSSRLRFIHTPGHGQNALTLLLDHGREQIAFCGDAAHAGATIHLPHNLEWDHWTGSGALAAWEGIERLRQIHIDLLCPGYGPSIESSPRTMLATLSRKLLAFYHAKGNICPDETDRYLAPEFLACGAARVLPNLYIAGTNTWVLVSKTGEALVFDPWLQELPALDALLTELGNPKVTAATATHFHMDHSDGLPALRERHGTRIFLHPRVAAPLAPISDIDAPWLPATPVMPDAFLPITGSWTWNEFEFRVAPFPGQTWWHAAFMTTIAGKRVFFGGDNFQANSRWNGTGGFSAFNGSRFREGFEASAKLVLDWKPHLFVNGHQVYFKFRPSHFRKIARWALQAEKATRDLCPTGDLERDYYLHHPAPAPGA